MKPPYRIHKVSALVCSIVLAVAFVVFRAGGFDRSFTTMRAQEKGLDTQKNEAIQPTLMSGTKAEELILPAGVISSPSLVQE